MARTGPFDRHSSAYERWFSDHRWVYESELKAIAALLPPGGERLEVGVGSGLFARPLGIRTGVEPSRPMRLLAAARGVDVHDAVAERLPFPDGRFDAVLMVTTICFVDDPASALREVWRVLKPRGVFVVGFVDKDSRLGRIYQRRRKQSLFYREATFYSVPELERLLLEAGMQPFRVVQTVFGGLDRITAAQDPREGSGEGGFVGIAARRS